MPLYQFTYVDADNRVAFAAGETMEAALVVLAAKMYAIDPKQYSSAVEDYLHDIEDGGITAHEFTEPELADLREAFVAGKTMKEALAELTTGTDEYMEDTKYDMEGYEVGAGGNIRSTTIRLARHKLVAVHECDEAESWEDEEYLRTKEDCLAYLDKRIIETGIALDNLRKLRRLAEGTTEYKYEY